MSTPLVVHVTHEASLKIGGIGAVLDGLLSTEAYNTFARRTILAGPWPGWDADQMQRILSPRSRLQVRWASRFDIWGQVPSELGKKLRQVETRLQIEILYGTAKYGDFIHEVVLVNPLQVVRQEVERFSYSLWADYGIEVSRYQHDLEFQGFIDLAVPLAQALIALTPDLDAGKSRHNIIAHDWMGLPTAFAMRQLQPRKWNLFFYAHEVAPVRRLVEEHEGHDTRFYNVMRHGLSEELYADNLFGSQHDLYKTPLIHAAARCDGILAVSDLVAQELRFLGADFRGRTIDLAYNGIPFRSTTVSEKAAARSLLQNYCVNLFGFVPDVILSHITRMVPSKALWRDAKVLGYLARFLHYAGKSAVLYVLSTSTPTGRDANHVFGWEAEYGWPVSHRADNGDLVGPEVSFFFDVVEGFNRSHANVKIAFVNQFGWEQTLCGNRMPSAMNFEVLRVGTDAEFGLSIYEPFGIAQLEPLTHGAICCASSACGCGGLVEKVQQQGVPVPLFVEADYISLPDAEWIQSAQDALRVYYGVRNHVEEAVSFDVAMQIQALLAQNETTRALQLEAGQAASKEMSWERMAKQYFVPALQRVDTARN